MGLYGTDFPKWSLIFCLLLSLDLEVLSKKVLPHHRCTVGNKIDHKEDIPCKPRSQVVSIPKLQPHDVFTPTAVVVNRCSGGCLNMRSCTPKAVESRCVLVEDKINLTKQFREVEEHLECSCCDITESMCNKKQRFLKKECICACKDKEEEYNCKQEDKEWDSLNCVCNCPEIKECDSKQIWSKKICSCVDKDVAEVYFG